MRTSSLQAMNRALPSLVATLALVAGSLVLAPHSSGAAHRRALSAAADKGVLQRFAPQSARVWWAVVASNLHAKTWVVRTTDSGRHWHDVTPPVKLVASSSFFRGKVAWIEAGALHAGAPGAPRTEPVYRTLNGGRSWRRLGRVPTECQLDFVDIRHGWCIGIGAAAGSESVRLYRTSDGGSSWHVVSRTSAVGQHSTPKALPFGCDKTIAFTTPRIGWAAEYCNGGRAGLFVSRDGGARWHELPLPPIPKGAPRAASGGGISLPAIEGSRGLAVALQLDGTPRPRFVIAMSTNRGRSWHSRLVPGDPRYGTIDLIDVRHFVLSNGTTLLVSNDSGRHWRSLKATKKFLNTLGTPLTPDFLSEAVGFAISPSSGPMWWTHDHGTSWRPFTVKAGPFTLPH